MATISLNIPDAAMPRVRNALCASIGLTGADSTNANAKKALADIVKTLTQQHDLHLATQAANAAVAPVPDIT
jgi:hypothetical protein